MIVKPQNKLCFKVIEQKCPIVLSDNFTVNIFDIKYKCCFFFNYLSNYKSIISLTNH